MKNLEPMTIVEMSLKDKHKWENDIIKVCTVYLEFGSPLRESLNRLLSNLMNCGFETEMCTCGHSRPSSRRHMRRTRARTWTLSTQRALYVHKVHLDTQPT